MPRLCIVAGVGVVSVLKGDVVIFRRGVSAYCGGSGLQVRDIC